MPHRAPIGDTFRKKSPFDGLLAHMNKVKECIIILEEGIGHYVEMDYAKFEDVPEEVSQIEHEADLIKSNIRGHLPKSILMPVDKRYFLWILREQDAILDHAENLAQMLALRHTKIPIKLKEDYKDHMRLVAETVEEMERAVENIRDLIGTGFSGKERDETKEMIKTVHEREWEADKKRYEITKKIYKLEDSLSPMDMYHLLKMVDWIDDIADHAENVADWLRAIVAK
jgi:predicted phosphate transport protein (TIGR00153 family)